MNDWKMPIPKIILEGTHLTRKTDLSFELAEHPRVIGQRRHRWHIPLVSSEWETKSDIQPTKRYPGSSLINFQGHEESWALEGYHTWARLFELHAQFYWIVDRFHISTRVHQYQTNGRRLDFSWLEDRLNKLNFRLVHCVRRADTFAEAREERLVYSEAPERYNNLQSFIEEQELIREFVHQSTLPSIEVDVSDGDLSRASKEVLDWVEASGGYYK